MKSKTVCCGFKKGEMLIIAAKTDTKKSVCIDDPNVSESIDKITTNVSKIMNQLGIKRLR